MYQIVIILSIAGYIKGVYPDYILEPCEKIILSFYAKSN